MAAPHSSASPPLDLSKTQDRNRVAEALYSWCVENHEVGHVFDQAALLSSAVVPNRDLQTLLAASNYLIAKNLFKLHDIKASNVVGWELVSQERAANYTGLSRDEHLVFAAIDSSGSAGIWTKNILRRLNAHAKVLERTLKTLESKGLIRTMKSVKHPSRKMFIVAGLQPNEEATGGAWYTDGILDVALLTVVADLIESFVSRKSWVEVEEDRTRPLSGSTNVNNKRKIPHEGFDVKGKGKAKAARIDDNQPRSETPELHRQRPKQHKGRGPKSYVPQQPGYQGYPTLTDITRYINSSKITMSIFPQTAIAQLLEILVFDERLFKIKRSTREDELPDEGSEDTITMYRCFKSPAAREKTHQLSLDFASEDSQARKAARRLIELEEIGRGGISEVPCLKCPAFELCGDGGPVNVVTCPYYDEWYVKAARADRDVDPWPGGDEFIREGENKKDRRLKNLPAVPVKLESEEKVVDLTKTEE